MLAVFDLIGTFAFASSGALVARRARLDLFGAFVLSLAAGTAGGVMRDVLVGFTPPVALTEWRYAAVAAGATAAVAFRGRLLETRLKQPITILDAFGLGLFATTGTWRALDASLPVVTALFVGVVTAVGGGVVRDVLVTRVPVVLRREVYALAAAAGSALVVVADVIEIDRVVAGIVAVVVTVSLRLLAAYQGWNLPRL
ncbi:MAG TPA: TRIC cation channel family protein [Actinomycetota bacterium]|nr:TRIC cation channel family protein [Actinomycetota bacterium]